MRGPPPRPSTTPVRAPQSQPFLSQQLERPREIHLRRTHLDSTTRYRFPEYPYIDCTAAPTQHANCYKAASPQPGHDIGVPGPCPSTVSLHTAEPTCTQSNFRLFYSDLQKLRILRALHMTSPPGRARLAHIQRLSRVAALHTRAGLEPRPGGEKPPPTHPTPSPNPPPANAA